MLRAGKLHVNTGMLHTESIADTLNFEVSIHSQIINVNSLKTELPCWAFATHGNIRTQVYKAILDHADVSFTECIVSIDVFKETVYIGRNTSVCDYTAVTT